MEIADKWRLYGGNMPELPQVADWEILDIHKSGEMEERMKSHGGRLMEFEKFLKTNRLVQVE